MTVRTGDSASWYLPLFAGTEVVRRSGGLTTFPAEDIVGTLPGRPPWALSGLVLWLDAADLPSIRLQGGGVYQWTDKSGSSNNATQTVPALRPEVATDNFSPRAIDFKD
jgi:hypothetical protein